MVRRPALIIVLVALLVAALATTAVAEPQTVQAKKCFKKKRGKRVRVKCPKKKTTPAKPVAPAPAPAPMTDPAAIDALHSSVTGWMLHRFATSAFPGDEKLYLCGDGTYAYLATLGPTLTGLAGLGKTIERGTWLITGADFSADRTRLDGGLLLLPGDGTQPHLAKLAAQTTAEGLLTFVNGEQWYVSSNGLCPG